MKTLVVTGQMIGGQIALTYQVDNYPGFPEGVTGPELVGLMKSQAERFGAEFLETDATAVDFSSRPLKVFVEETEYQGNSVIIATGSLNRKLGLESEERLMGRGVFVCATCDAILYEGKRVVVIGGGDSAVQEAIDLANFAMEIVLNQRLAPGHSRRLEFVEKELDEPVDEEPGFTEFLRDRSLSGDIAEEEIQFLNSMRFKGKRPTSLYYYRALQNLRDPLHFREE